MWLLRAGTGCLGPRLRGLTVLMSFVLGKKELGLLEGLARRGRRASRQRLGLGGKAEGKLSADSGGAGGDELFESGMEVDSKDNNNNV